MPDTNPPSSVRIGIGLTALGISGAVVTALMGVYYAPVVDSTAFNAPEAYRILYWHVPFAWSSFLAFCMLFIGAVAWYKDRSDWGWRWFSTGSDLGLLFGLGVITSGPIWGSAEWGVPWDWGDLRLNTFALLTGVALFLVLSRRSQPRRPGNQGHSRLSWTIRICTRPNYCTGNDVVPEETPWDSFSERRGDGLRSWYQDSTNDGLHLLPDIICWTGNAK